jgi:NADH dehydrogenase (ubiquinone) 1 beta subcomplex subunit 3
MSNLPLFRDTWAKREAWRKHPVFSNRSMFRSMFPGFGIAVVAFTAYVMMEDVWGAIKKREGTKDH